MPRIDVWAVKPKNDAPVTLGLSRNFAERYAIGQELGRGGFGVVRVVTDRDSGEQLACKTIPKKLAVPNLSAEKQAQHLDKIKRELEVIHTKVSQMLCLLSALSWRSCAAWCETHRTTLLSRKNGLSPTVLQKLVQAVAVTGP